MAKLDRRERNLLILAFGSMALVAGSYALRFYALPISPNSSDWGALGGYFGGIVGPILTALLVWVVLNEAAEARRNFFETKQLQVKSQDQIDKQIALLTPRAEIVYYPMLLGDYIYAVIENIGNATAYNISFDFRPEGQIEKSILEALRKLGNPRYIPPKYKMSVGVSYFRQIDRNAIDLPPHSVSLEWSSASDHAIDNSRIFVVDRNMLSCLHREPNYSDYLSD